MVLYIGAFQLVPLLAIMLLVVVLALVAAALSLAFSGAAFGGTERLLAALGALTLVIALFEWAARWRGRRLSPRWLVPLSVLSRTEAVGVEAVGEKARYLATLRALGLAVPDGAVLTVEACRQIDRLPVGARMGLRRLRQRTVADRWIVRSSFPGEDGERAHAGVYDTVDDVDPRDPDALHAAIKTVLASSGFEVARAYREMHGLDEAPDGAVLLQEEIEAEELGVAFSRTLDGRADAVTMEYGPVGEDIRSFVFDIFLRRLIPLSMAGPPTEAAPPWVAELADTLIALEVRLGSPVQVEFAVSRGTIAYLQVRRVSLPSRRRCLINDGPIALGTAPLDPLVLSMRGGLDGLRHVLAWSLRSVGIHTGIGRQELELVGGVPYLDCEVFRRVTAAALQPSLRAAARQARALLFPPPPQLLRELPEHARPDDVPRFLRWYYARAMRAQVVAVTRLSLLTRTIAWIEASPEVGARAIRAWLAFQARRTSRERDRLRAYLVAAEARVIEVLGRALGADDDVHRYGTIDEIEEALGDADAAARWRRVWSERAAAAPRGESPPRRHDPPLPDAEHDGDAVTGWTVHAGEVEGVLLHEGVSLGDDEAGAPVVRILVDGAPERIPSLRGAAAVVLRRGGLLSHLATTAAERGLPTLLCLDDAIDAWPDGSRVELSATRGTLRRVS